MSESEGETQQTLTGGEVDAETLVCDKHHDDICSKPAEYVVEVLDMELGEEIDVKCCSSCKSEFAEWVASDKIRTLSRAERWSA